MSSNRHDVIDSELHFLSLIWLADDSLLVDGLHTDDVFLAITVDHTDLFANF